MAHGRTINEHEEQWNEIAQQPIRLGQPREPPPKQNTCNSKQAHRRGFKPWVPIHFISTPFAGLTNHFHKCHAATWSGSVLVLVTERRANGANNYMCLKASATKVITSIKPDGMNFFVLASLMPKTTSNTARRMSAT